MKINNYLFLLVFSSILFGCSSFNEITLQQMRPAKVNFPAEIRNIGVIDFAPNSQRVDVIGEKMDGNLKICCENFAKRIADSHYFDNVIISDSTLLIPVDTVTNQISLNINSIKRLCDQLGVEAICTFDKMEINFHRVDNSINSPLPLLIGKVTPSVHIYIPERERPMCSLSSKDTLYWDLMPYSRAQDIIDDASYFASNKMAEMVVPYWENERKYYYDGGEVRMRDAGVLLRENNWDKAKDLWKSVYNDNKKNSIKAAYNLALYYDYTDSINESIKWIDRAFLKAKEGTDDYYNIKFYKSKLRKRLNNIPKLEMQLHRFK